MIAVATAFVQLVPFWFLHILKSRASKKLELEWDDNSAFSRARLDAHFLPWRMNVSNVNTSQLCRNIDLRHSTWVRLPSTFSVDLCTFLFSVPRISSQVGRDLVFNWSAWISSQHDTVDRGHLSCEMRVFENRRHTFTRDEIIHNYTHS